MASSRMARSLCTHGFAVAPELEQSQDWRPPCGMPSIRANCHGTQRAPDLQAVRRDCWQGGGGNATSLSLRSLWPT
eukprot:7057558-Alexandrium_andersonii.AAC.1